MFKRWLDFLFGVPLIRILVYFKRQPREIGEPRRILVIKLAAVGDTILLIPVLHSFRDRHPTAKIDWLVSSINKGIAETVPYVDDTLLWQGTSPFRLLPLIRRLRRERYDAVFDAEQWARGTALISFFSGAPVRVGFDTPGQHRAGLYTHTLKKTFVDHELFDFYNLLSIPGPLRRQPRLELKETDAGRREVEELFLDLKQRKKSLVLIHPGCGADGRPRDWPLENYAVLARWMPERFDAAIILTSGPEETKKTSDLNRLLGGLACEVGGRLSWLGLVSLVRTVDLVISGNTGVMHIAATFQKKQVALHGPTNPALWGPINPNAIVITSSCPRCPCLRLGFEYHRRDQSCMKRIEVETVKQAVARLLGNSGEMHSQRACLPGGGSRGVSQASDNEGRLVPPKDRTAC